jgi:hypothetical protein
MTILEKLTSDIKRDILFKIILHLRRHEITLEEAKYLAQDFLAVFPAISVEELLKSMSKLGENYKEARSVFIKYAVAYYEEQKKHLLTVVPPYIYKGDITTAVNLLKGGEYNG